MYSTAELVPLVVGVNDTWTVQLPPGTSVPQALKFAVKALDVETLAAVFNVRGAVPVFVTVMPWGEDVVPTDWGGNVRLRVDNVASGAD
jgi:hypothetical protein